MSAAESLDPEIERILAMSDDEILADVRASGEDPEQVAAEMRALFEQAVKLVAVRAALEDPTQ